MTGNESIARGFYEAGGFLASSYPGSPTVEILDAIKSYKRGYVDWAPNEKVALEMAIGSSISGARSLVSMKHVGVNIALDPLMTFTQTSVNGGFVLVVGDDPGMKSSQNEQDSRILAKFSNMPVLVPSDNREAKEFTKDAFWISEEFQTPVMIQMTSRLCHSRSVVDLEPPLDIEVNGYEPDVSNHAMIPPYTHKKQYEMNERIEKLEGFSTMSSLNKLEEKEGADTLVITSGLLYHNLKELDPQVSILKLGLVYPLPKEQISKLVKQYKNIIVLEEMMPFIENELKTMGVECEGKKYFSFTGELFTEDIKKGLSLAGVMQDEISTEPESFSTPERPPLMCSGCPHRPVFDLLKKSKVTVVGDIGCYSLGLLPPFEVSKINISMGASLGITRGMRKAFNYQGNNDPIVALIGDGTFYHSGLSGIVNLAKSSDKHDNITVIVLDNSTTAMTGGQDTPSSSKYKETDIDLDISSVLSSLGFSRITKVDQFDYQKTKEVFEEEIKHDGLSAIITTRPCALKYKIKEQHYYVNPNVCIGCRNCVNTNCPPISMKKYSNNDKLKSYIDPDMCVGCSVCSQVCPVGAIRPFKGGQ
ncbi:indolepyruvate ferredoxin oxidoreductase [Natranaerobius trueperi]|uniref:Indolepyruvate oxidoreductase subunit IorA n=2 Tax=Natranaerobius trueperi TaxID=759412 RepID=A0A226C1X5_9FIRM|nr:indolepyruvate ferredoxin oxidoreductase [Natranaerobius trueperi]